MKKMAPRPDRPTDGPVAKTIPVSRLPKTAPDGTIMTNAAKYSRNAVLTAFEMIGGTQALAEWAQDNKTDFYKTIFTKTIQRDVEVGVSDGVEALLGQLDAKKQVEMEDELTIEGEFEMVEGEYEQE
jgi:hypothetical protein